MRSITHTNLWNKRRRNEREKPYTEENTCLAKPAIPSNQTIDRLRAQVRSPRFNTCAIYLCMYTVRVRRANSPRRRFDSEIFTVRQLTCVPHSRFLRYCYTAVDGVISLGDAEWIAVCAGMKWFLCEMFGKLDECPIIWSVVSVYLVG